MSLQLIFGKNKTGKTYYLEKLVKDDNKSLYIPAEVDLEDTIKKENIGTPTKPIITPHWKILNFLNDILFPRKLKFKLDDMQQNTVKESKKIIETFNKRMEGSGDIFFEDWFKSFLRVDNRNEIDVFHNFLLKNNGCKIQGSSGSLNYSLIKFLYEIVKSDNLNLDKSYTLIIDEIEKFSHPEMINRIAGMIFEISKKINVIVSTHSPFFLERILFNHKYSIKNSDSPDIIYKISHNRDEDLITLNNDIIMSILNKNQYREISNFSSILFSSNVFLVEGINDRELIYDLINNNKEYKDVFYSIIDCGCKTGVKKAYDNIAELGIECLFKICLVYDLDKDLNAKKFDIKDVFEIVSDPNIEEKLFVHTKDSTFEVCHGQFNKKDLNMTKEWILENSTKPDVSENLKEFEKSINDFLSK